MILWIWLVPIIEAGVELLAGAAIGAAAIGAVAYIGSKIFDFVTKPICKDAVKESIRNAYKAAIKDKSSHVVKLDIFASDGKEYEMKIEGRNGVSDDIEEGDVIYV